MIIPVGERVLVKQDKEEISKAGIILAEGVEESMKKSFGKVVLIGSLVNKDYHLNVGDTVFFNAYAGEQVTEADKTEWLLLKPTEVLAKLSTS